MEVFLDRRRPTAGQEGDGPLSVSAFLLSEPEAKRFEENFSQDGASQHLLELSIGERDKDEYAPLGELLPPKVMETLTERITLDPDMAMQFIQGLVHPE